MHDPVVGELVGLAVYTEGLRSLDFQGDPAICCLHEPSDVITVRLAKCAGSTSTRPTARTTRRVTSRSTTSNPSPSTRVRWIPRRNWSPMRQLPRHGPQEERHRDLHRGVERADREGQRLSLLFATSPQLAVTFPAARLARPPIYTHLAVSGPMGPGSCGILYADFGEDALLGNRVNKDNLLRGGHRTRLLFSYCLGLPYLASLVLLTLLCQYFH